MPVRKRLGMEGPKQAGDGENGCSENGSRNACRSPAPHLNFSSLSQREITQKRRKKRERMVAKGEERM
jgi:hypothetical protein